MKFLALLLAAVPMFERPVSAPVYGDAPGVQQHARVATNGLGYFAVWTDSRAGLASIHGARFTADGTPLDELSIRLGTGSDADVVWTGSDYFVAWASDEGEILGVSVTANGGVGETRAIAEPMSPPPAAISLATNGSTILVTGGTRGILLRRDGAPLFVQVPSTTVDIAAMQDRYLLFATNRFGLAWMLLSAAGEPLSPPIGSPFFVPLPHTSVATDGSQFLAVSGGSDLRAGVRTADMQPGAGFAILDPAEVSDVRAAWRGNEYLVTYSREGKLYALRVAADAKPIGSPMHFGENRASTIADVSPGAIVWTPESGGVRLGVFDDVSLAAGAPFVSTSIVNRSATAQYGPVVRRIGNMLAVAWHESTPDLEELRITFESQEPVLVDRGAGRYRAYDVAFDGERVWVFWTVGGTVRFRRFTPELAPIDVAPVALEPLPLTAIARATSGDGAVLLLWQTLDGEPRGASVLRGDERADISFRHQGPIAAGWMGTEFMIVTGDSNRIVARRVTRDGIMGEPVVIANAGPELRELSVDGPLIAWQDVRGTFATTFLGGPHPQSALIGLPDPDEQTLGPIVRMNAQTSLFTWWRRDGATHTVSYKRYPIDFTTSSFSIPFAAITPDPIVPLPLWYDVSAIGTAPYFAYVRRADERQYGGVPRVFLRQGVSRRRAVERSR